jgi:hypothetical protein
MKFIQKTTLVSLVAATSCLLAPIQAIAQTAAPAAKAAVKPVHKKKPPVSASRKEIKSTAKNIAVAIEAADAALTPAELSIAERVYVGKLPCELGADVTLTPDAKTPGYFDVHGKNFKYRMFPVLTTTGAIRLEDRKAGAVWLQLANKSMLMNQKLGTRIADECASPAQIAVAEAIKLNPPVSVLDAPKVVATAPASVAAASSAPVPATPASAAQ